MRDARRAGAKPLAAFVLLIIVAQQTGAALSAEHCGLREQDELWLVSCRHLGCGGDEHAARLKYYRYDREQAWVPSRLDEILANDEQPAPTIILVHGNRISWCEAFTNGWTAYRRLIACGDPPPIRFVIWSWPSEAIRGPVQDAREKAARADPAGYYLAWFADRLQPQSRLSVWAHSYGARVATAALHLLGGGRLNGRQLDHRAHPTREAMKVALLGAALDDDWLLPGHRNGQAMSQMSKLLLVNNGCDRLLKHYHLLYANRGRQQALGYVGLASWCVAGHDWSKVRQIDAGCQIGHSHAFADYLGSPSLVASMRATLLPEVVLESVDAEALEAQAVGPSLPGADDAENAASIAPVASAETIDVAPLLDEAATGAD